MWAAETFDLTQRPDDHFSRYHTELTYRTVGFYRDSYMSTVMAHLRLPARSPAESADDVLRKVRAVVGSVECTLVCNCVGDRTPWPSVS